MDQIKQYLTKKNITIGAAVVVTVIIVVVVVCMMKKEKYGSATAAGGNLLSVDANGNLGITDIATQLAGSGITTGMTRYIGSYTDNIASGTVYAQGATVLTMMLSGLTPGNTLIITALCPVYAVNSNINTVPAALVLTAAVGSSGSTQTIYYPCWATDNLNSYTPPLTYIVTSDPSGGSTQTLTISAKSIYGSGTCPMTSPYMSTTATCTVMEVSK